jgi:hypothetical protein
MYRKHSAAAMQIVTVKDVAELQMNKALVTAFILKTDCDTVMFVCQILANIAEECFLERERVSAKGCMLVTPCCSNGKVCRFHLYSSLLDFGVLYCKETLIMFLQSRDSYIPESLRMQVRVNVPADLNAMQDIFNEPNFPKTSRAVNHLCDFVTTHVAPRGGRAFHE